MVILFKKNTCNISAELVHEIIEIINLQRGSFHSVLRLLIV